MSFVNIIVTYHGEQKLAYTGETVPKEGEWIKMGKKNFQVNNVVHHLSNEIGGDTYPTNWLGYVECEAGRFFEED